MVEKFYKVDLKSMSVEDLLDEYSYWDREWDNCWKDPNTSTDEERRLVWDRRYDVIEEFKQRCGEVS